MSTNLSIKQYIQDPAVNARVQELLHDRASQFIVSLLSMVNTNDSLADCEHKSLFNAALTAASLNLPINQNLGFAYIVGYKQKDGTKLAQFQMGWKGYLQLAQRSGQFRTINVSDVKKGEIKKIDRLTGDIDFEWIEEKRETIVTVGYVAYMQLKNGFRKSLYMTVEELNSHGLKFSQTMKRGYGLWKDDFDSMAKKTVIKLLLSKYAPLTVDMAKAQLADQSVVWGEDQYQYVDNQPIVAEDVAKEKEKARIQKHIAESTTIKELEKCKAHLADDETKKLYADKMAELEFEEAAKVVK